MRTLILIPLLCLITSVALAQSTSTLAAFSELEEGWNTFKPGGETLCAHGTEYQFYVRPADPERLLIYLYGGGGCWDAEECQEGSREYIAEADRHPSRLGGVLDVQNVENPFVEYTIVAVPVCTGDAHLGANDVVYVLEDEDGSTREFTIHHRGKINSLSAVNWALENVPVPRQVFVAGSSAGSLGVSFHASVVAHRHSGVPVAAIGDGGGSFGPEPAVGTDYARWGLPDVLRPYPGWEDFEVRDGVQGLFTTAGRHFPNLRLFQVDYANDMVQAHHIQRTGIGSSDVHALIVQNRDAIRAHLPEFRGYTMGGMSHVVLWANIFYRHVEEGYPLRDWVAAIASGEDVPDVSCDDCHRAALLFHEEDLVLVASAVTLLQAPDAWNPVDPGGGCPVAAERFSLRCAVVEAGRRTGVPVANSAVAFELSAAAAENEPAWRGPNSVIHFNNHEGATVEDVIGLLEEIRERIRTQLEDA
jgi:hypothetical protein